MKTEIKFKEYKSFTTEVLKNKIKNCPICGAKPIILQEKIENYLTINGYPRTRFNFTCKCPNCLDIVSVGYSNCRMWAQTAIMYSLMWWQDIEDKFNNWKRDNSEKNLIEFISPYNPKSELYTFENIAKKMHIIAEKYLNPKYIDKTINYRFF